MTILSGPHRSNEAVRFGMPPSASAQRLNDPRVLQALRAQAIPNPYPADWHPLLDMICETLEIEVVYVRMGNLRSKIAFGSSFDTSFYEDRTIFLTKQTRREGLPVYHELGHAIVAYDDSPHRLELPNFGVEEMPVRARTLDEELAQTVQFALAHRCLPKAVVDRCYRAYYSDPGAYDIKVGEALLNRAINLHLLSWWRSDVEPQAEEPQTRKSPA